jgi:hypothetical protein
MMTAWDNELDPEPPTNVRLVDSDGGTWPVQCTYEGVWDDVHRWRIIVPRGFDPGPNWKIRCERLPAPGGLSVSFMDGKPTGETVWIVNRAEAGRDPYPANLIPHFLIAAILVGALVGGILAAWLS